VPPRAQLPLLLPLDTNFAFTPTPIGETQPVLQAYTLRNGGPAPLSYSLDVFPLATLAKDSFGFEVLRYAGGASLTGQIPAGEVALFNWVFQPLEARPYAAVLPLTVGADEEGRSGSSSSTVVNLTLTGRGYHPKEQAPEDKQTPGELARQWRRWLGFSATPALHPSWRPLTISPEVLSLGPCLVQGASRRLLRLDNRGARPLDFSWDLGVFDEARGAISGRLQVQPDVGLLEPGESLVCQVVFLAGVTPQVFEGEVRCVVSAAEEEEGCSLEQQHQPGPLLGYPAAAAAGASSASTGLVVTGLGQQQCGVSYSGGAGGALEDDVTEEIIAIHPARFVGGWLRGWVLACKSDPFCLLTCPLPPSAPIHPPNRPTARSPTNQHNLEERLQRERLPLHESMTVAALGKSQPLQHRFEQSLQARITALQPSSSSAASLLQQRSFNRSSRWAQEPACHRVVVVTLCGAVITKDQAKIGAYVPADECADARRLTLGEPRCGCSVWSWSLVCCLEVQSPNPLLSWHQHLNSH